MFYNNYIEFYKIEIETDINNKRIYFFPKVNEPGVAGQSYELKLSCFDGSIIIKLIKGYKYLVSPLLTPSCRYLPTCSEYSIEALQNFGFFGFSKDVCTF